MSPEPSTATPATSLDEFCINTLHFSSIDAVQTANSGYPERGPASGVKTTTGRPGQRFGNSAGMAEAELAACYSCTGFTRVDHHTCAIVSDGELRKGAASETAALEDVPIPVISAALYAHFYGRGNAGYASRILSAMRRQFGGHDEKTAAR